MRKNHLKKIHASIILVASFLGIVLISPSYGQGKEASRKGANATVDATVASGNCTTRNVAGTYGFSATGTFLVPTPSGNPPLLYSAIATVTLDGSGNFSVPNQVENFNGNIVPTPPFAGTYTVNPDCTATLINRFGNTVYAVFVDNRKEILAMASNPGGVVITFVAKRLN